MLAGLASVALTLVGGFLSDLPLLLELVLELSAVDDILCAQFNGVKHPLEEFGQRDGVLLNLFDFLLVLLQGLFEEPQLLVEGGLLFLGSERIVLTNALEEFSTILVGSEKDLAGFLPLDLVGVTLANVFSGEAKQVEEALEDLCHLDNIVLAEGQDSFAPLVGS